MMIMLYVDDLFLAEKRNSIEFQERDLLPSSKDLDMEVWQNADGISLDQGKYVVEILKRIRMMDYKAMTTHMASNLKLLSDASSEMVDTMMYHQMISSLMYLTNTRPDIFFSMNTLRHVHLMVAKLAVRYLKGTLEYGINYDTNQKIKLEGSEDSDWIGSAIDRKSTSRCYLRMGSSVISWFGRMESCMALSTTKENMLPLVRLYGR